MLRAGIAAAAAAADGAGIGAGYGNGNEEGVSDQFSRSRRITYSSWVIRSVFYVS